MTNKTLTMFAIMAIFVAMAMPVSASSFITTGAQLVATDIITSDYQQYEYMATQSSYTAYFNEKPLGAHFVKIIADKSQLNFKFYDPNPNNVDAIVNGKNIRYNSIATATDVWYDVGNDTVKETIKLYNTSGSIIKSRVQTELTPTIINGDILWKRGEETIFRMPRPYATDANNNYIDGDYVLTQNGINWDIEISISSSWLANAVYPVEIDPTLITISSTSTPNERKIAIDSGGNLYFVDQEVISAVTQIKLWKSTNIGSTWTNIANLSTGTGNKGEPALEIDGYDRIWVVWTNATLVSQLGVWNSNGSVNISVSNFGREGGYPSIAINDSNHVLVIKTNTTALHAYIYNSTGSQISDSVVISASEYVYDADAVSNNFFAATSNASTGTLGVARYNGSAWSQTYISGSSLSIPRISCKAVNDCIMVAHYDPTNNLTFTKWNGTAWSSWSIFTTGIYDLPSVAHDGNIYYAVALNNTGRAFFWTYDGISWSNATFIGNLTNIGTTAHLAYQNIPTTSRIYNRLHIVGRNATNSQFYINYTVNVPPVVTINYPTNITILAINVTMNWTVTDDSTASLTCWRYLDGVQKYTGSIANGTTTNEFMGNVSIGSHNVSVTCQDGAPTNTTATTYFSVLHWNETNQTFSNPVYETNLTNFNITFNITGNVANITGNLTYNNTNYPATTTSVGSTFVMNVTNLRVPLVETNNTIKNFNWSYVVSYTNGTNTSAQTSTNYNHSVYWAYYITAIASPATALELDNVTFNTTVATQLQVATLSTNTTFNGTAYTTSVVGNSSTQRNYSMSIIMPNPPSSSTLYVWNSTLYVSYGNQSFARASSNSNITVKQMVLALCAGNATLPAFNFTFYTEEDDKIVNATNLSSTANKFEATFWAFKNGSSYQRNYTFNLTGNVSYPICLEHNETSFLVDAHIRYYNTSYSTRNYFLENYTVDNVTDNISLYLLETTLSSPISFEIRESNGINPAASVVIQALRFYPDKNVYRIVAMALTDGDGKGFSYLKMNTVFHKFRLYRDGEFMREIEQGVLGGADVAAGLTLTYSLTVTSLAEIMEIYEQVAGSCTSNNATAIVTCTYDDSSTHLQTMYLTIQKLSNVSWVSICTNSSITDNGTLTCSAASAGNGTYYYWLYGKFASSTLLTIKIADGSFNVGQLNIFGTAGLLFSAILIIALVMIGSFNPIVTIFMGITGLVVSSILGMLDISLAALVGIIIVGIIIAIKSRG